MNKLIHWLKSKHKQVTDFFTSRNGYKSPFKHWLHTRPIKYYHAHAIIAVGTMITLSLLFKDWTVGYCLVLPIYPTREVVQYGYEKKWDHPGWFWPTFWLSVLRIGIEIFMQLFAVTSV